MKLSDSIDLGKSLLQVFGNNEQSRAQVARDSDRQTRTAEAILERFFSAKVQDRREMMILADEVGMGKTYIALAVAVTILERIKNGSPPEGLPANKPVVLVLIPNNAALYNKWHREAAAFQEACAGQPGAFDWLQIKGPVKDDASKS